MKMGCLSLIFTLFIAFVGPAQADQEAEKRLETIKVLNAIVKIRSIIPDDARTARILGTEREGSGVVIDSKGYILTIGYLILEAETIEVVGVDGEQISATFIGYDHTTGFGLVRADKSLHVEPMKLGESSEVKEGTPVLVAAYGGSESVQAARVISRQEFTGYWEYLLDDAIFAAPPHPNFGGAALIGHDGQLLGIGSIFTQLMIKGVGSVPCNMFVPIDFLKPILADLIATGRSREPPRPWLGINAEEAHGRVFVSQITSGGPAEKAGLQNGDIILTVKGRAVKGLADFYRKVWALGKAGVDVPLSILQGIQIREVTVHSADRYQYFHFNPKKRGTGPFFIERFRNAEGRKRFS